VIAAIALFSATAAVVFWQNAHVAVLFDVSYILNTAARIAAGQMPYRDFPLAHAPLTFLIQAAIIRLTGRVFFHSVLYVALVGGLGTVLAWRIAFNSLRGRMGSAWAIALLLAAPLTVVGIYCILPNPEYDCDCGFWLLVALWFLQRADFAFHPNTACTQNGDCHPEQPDIGCHPERVPARQDESKACPERRSPRRPESNGDLRLLFGKLRLHPFARGFAAGTALVVPLFFKQNMGLPFLLAVLAAVLLLLVVDGLRRGRADFNEPEARFLVSVLAGVAVTFSLAVLVLHFTAGLGNYFHWTIRFAAERRLPGFGDMLGVYMDPSLAWKLPCGVAALVLLQSGFGRKRWVQIAAFALLAAPFLFTLASLVIYDDADERGDTLLALWPLLLLLAAALALRDLFQQRRKPSLRGLLPLIILVAINGTFMSQQLWGSTYGIWPLLVLLVADLLAFLDGFARRNASCRWFAPALAGLISITLLVCGGFYTASEERLSYATLPDEPAQHSAFPELAGLATPGPYLPEIDELLRYAQANIPFNDGIVFVPGEEPFYYATGRVPRFPVPFFDPTIDPYSPAEVAALVRSCNIRWLIVKTDSQTKEDPTPDRAELMQLLMQEFAPAAHLRGYDVYRR